jgi:hypothetical protein
LPRGKGGVGAGQGADILWRLRKPCDHSQMTRVAGQDFGQIRKKNETLLDMEKMNLCWIEEK